jgi:hypothetical protein
MPHTLLHVKAWPIQVSIMNMKGINVPPETSHFPGLGQRPATSDLTRPAPTLPLALF